MWSTDTEPKVSGADERLTNVVVQHFRGITGVIGFIIIISVSIYGIGIGEVWQKVLMVYCLQFWSFLWQPVNVPVSGFIPLILFPMLGIISTIHVTPMYFTEGVGFFILSSMIGMLINLTGADRRIIIWFLQGDNYTTSKFLVRTGMAAFFTSVLGNRLIICLHMYDLTTPIFNKLGEDNKETKRDMKINEMRDVINNLIQISSTLGSIMVPHGACSIITFRTCFSEYIHREDCFNYLQYMCFSIPTTLFFFIVCIFYHKILMATIFGKQMDAQQQALISSHLKKLKEEEAYVTYHELLSVFFSFFYILMQMLRYSQWLGWLYCGDKVGDVTIAAIFVILLHILPNNIQFLKYFTAKTKDELPAARPASGQMWWKYVDTNVNYGYIFLIGVAVCYSKAFQRSQMESILQEKIEVYFDHGIIPSVIMITIIGCLLANIMSGVPACVLLMPVAMTFNTTPTWKGYTHIAALAVGASTSCGFMFPFRYWPAFYCHHKGKTSKLIMAQYSFPMVLFCAIFLFIFVALLGPVIWPAVAVLPTKKK